MATSARLDGAAQIPVGAAFRNGFNLLSRRTAEIVVAAFLLGSLPWIALDIFSQHLLAQIAVGTWQKAVIGLVATVTVEVMGMTAAFGLIARIAVAAADNHAEPIATSLDTTLRRYPAMVAMALLRDMATWVGLILLAVPGLILTVMWSVSTQAMVAEGLGPTAGLRRSSYLTHGVRWRILGLTLVIGILEAIGNYVVGRIGGTFYGGQTELYRLIGTEWPIWYIAAMAIYHGAVIAVSGSIFAALYVELRNAKDGPPSDSLAEVFA